MQFWRPRASFRRAWGLLTDFKYEQTRPDIFYGHLAADTVSLIEAVWRGATASDKEADTRSGNPTDSPVDGHTDNPPQGRSLAGTRVLDVGGGPGYFGVAFSKADATYYTCEPDVGEMAAAGIKLQSSVRGSGLDLPFLDNSFDITYSSNVAEHVPDPWRMADEMLRVTKPGGVVIYSYTVWLGPFGGHETGLWQHYVGGEFAARRYRRKHGKEPKNRWGESLFNVSAAAGLRYGWGAENPREAGRGAELLPADANSSHTGASATGAAPAADQSASETIPRAMGADALDPGAYPSSTGATPAAEFIAAFPRYHPWWAWWMVHIPGFREFAVSNLVIVLRKQGDLGGGGTDM
ncbi:class I SAM-dependent methyltransferase [Corynebacterium sp. HMSC28B08]|uniref:class I SAM-dependent methyltransferase n=1 Tax=Corynebacterium TaxID=1716 RepID=UPI0008D50455|nr:SAM-dependent methyltransferase [Corynebacterium sp. HMSC28B08]